MSKGETIDYYRERGVVDVYDYKRFGDQTGTYMHRKEIKIIRQELGRAKGTVLEVGCGTGRLTLELLKGGFNVVGLDISRIMLKKLKSRADREGVNLVLGDVERLPFKNGSAEAILSAYVLNHVPNYVQALNEVCRVASKRVIIIVPYFLSVLSLLALVINPIRKFLGRLNVFSRYFLPSDISKVLRANRLKVEQKGLYLIPPKIVSVRLVPLPIIKFIEKLSLCLKKILGMISAVQVTIGVLNDGLDD